MRWHGCDVEFQLLMLHSPIVFNLKMLPMLKFDFLSAKLMFGLQPFLRGSSFNKQFWYWWDFGNPVRAVFICPRAKPSANRLFTFKLQLASVCSNGKRENSPIKQIIKFPFEKKLQHTGFSFRCPLLRMFGVLPNTPTRFSTFGQNPHRLFCYSWQLGKTKKSTDFKSSAVPKCPHVLGGDCH